MSRWRRGGRRRISILLGRGDRGEAARRKTNRSALVVSQPFRQMLFEFLAEIVRLRVGLEKISLSRLDLALELNDLCQLLTGIAQLVWSHLFEEQGDVVDLCFLVQLLRQLPFFFRPGRIPAARG